MEVKISNQDGLDAVLSVKVSEQDYQQELEKSLADYRKNMTVPGFRKGKVPQGMVRKLIEKDAKRELIHKYLQQNIQDYLKDNDVKLVLSPLSDYEVEDINWKDKDFEFNYSIGLRPEIKIDYKKLNELSKYVPEISDKEVNEEIDRMRKHAGEIEQIEGFDLSVENIHARVSFLELDENGQKLEGGLEKSKIFTKDDMPAKLAELLKGKKKDEKVNADIFSIFSEKEIVDNFGVEKMTVKDLNKNFEVELKNLFKLKLPELNQEFFDRYLEPGKATNEEEFKAEWKKLLEDYYKQQADNQFAREIKKFLSEETKVDMPENFLNKYMLLSYDAKSESDIADYEQKKEAFVKELTWLLLSEQTAEQQGIDVTEQDVIDYTKHMVQNELMRAGMQDIEDATLTQYAINYLGQESNYSKTLIALRDGKVLEYLVKEVKPKEKKVSLNEFEEIRKKQ